MNCCDIRGLSQNTVEKISSLFVTLHIFYNGIYRYVLFPKKFFEHVFRVHIQCKFLFFFFSKYKQSVDSKHAPFYLLSIIRLTEMCCSAF